MKNIAERNYEDAAKNIMENLEQLRLEKVETLVLIQVKYPFGSREYAVIGNIITLWDKLTTTVDILAPEIFESRDRIVDIEKRLSDLESSKNRE